MFFLAFEAKYHGDTFGAMSVGVKYGFHDVFCDLLSSVLKTSSSKTQHENEEEKK